MSTRNKAAADAEVIHIPACRRLAQICWLLDFHMAVSSASPPPPRLTVPLALALNRFPRVTGPGQMELAKLAGCSTGSKA